MSILGRGFAFPPHFHSDGRAAMVEDLEDIRESLHILIRTRRGERVMQHAYGTTLNRLVFEPADLQTRSELAEELRLAILYFEPRVEVEQIDARVSAEDLARIDLLIDLRIRSTNTRHNLVFPLYRDQASEALRLG